MGQDVVVTGRTAATFENVPAHIVGWVAMVIALTVIVPGGVLVCPWTIFAISSIMWIYYYGCKPMNHHDDGR